MPVMCRRLQPLIKPMAVHLKSQHRLNVVPGILHRSPFSGRQHADFIKPAPQLPFELLTRKSTTGSAEPVSTALSANGMTGPKDSPAGFKPVYGAPSPAR